MLMTSVVYYGLPCIIAYASKGRGAENARLEKARLEKAAPNCRVGIWKTPANGKRGNVLLTDSQACFNHVSRNQALLLLKAEAIPIWVAIKFLKNQITFVEQQRTWKPLAKHIQNKNNKPYMIVSILFTASVKGYLNPEKYTI